MKSQVCKIANELSRKMDRSTAFAQAWKTVKLQAAMRSKYIQFTYFKNDGELREATGTLNLELAEYQPKGSDRKYNPIYVRYYDLERGAFRQFNAGRLQKFFI